MPKNRRYTRIAAQPVKQFAIRLKQLEKLSPVERERTVRFLRGPEVDTLYLLVMHDGRVIVQFSGPSGQQTITIAPWAQVLRAINPTCRVKVRYIG